MWGLFCRKYVLRLVITSLLISLSVITSYGAVPYDRTAARDEACNNNFDDSSFRGGSDGRYSPTYVATVMDAGGITIATPPSSVLGYNVIQNWMVNNEDDWTFVASLAELDPGDFVLFSPQDVPPGGYGDYPNYYFEHGAVYLGTQCVGGGSGPLGTWNNERLDIGLPDISIIGAGNPVVTTFFVHIIDNEPPAAPTYIAPTNGASDVSVDTNVQWNVALDPDGDAVTYTVRFGQNPDTSGATTPLYTALSVLATNHASTTFTPPAAAVPRGGLLPNTSYCYHITSVDSNDAATTTAAVACFRTTFVRAPSNLELTSNTLTTITLAWDYNTTTPPALADEFEVQWSNDPDTLEWQNVSPLQTDHPVAVNTTTFTHVGLSCSRFVYHYRIRAYRAADNLYSAYSSAFMTNTRVCSFEAPILRSPADGTQVLNTAPIPNFQWIATELADNYELLIRRLDGSLVYRSGNLLETSYCTDGICTITNPAGLPTPLLSLPINTTLTWEIAGIFLSRRETSTRWRFVRTAYLIPTPIAPIGEVPAPSRGDIVYQWSEVPDATEYVLTIFNADNTRRGNPLIVPASACTASVCSYRPSDVNPALYLLRNGTYRWLIQSKGAAGTSQPSERVTFTLNMPGVGLVDQIAPDNVTLVTATPTFTWLPVPYANQYEILIRVGTTVIRPLRPYHNAVCTETLCEYTLPDTQALTNRNNYNWIARVYNSPTGVGAFNENLPFSILVGMPGAVTLISPADTAVVKQRPVVFQWNESADAVSYNLRIFNPTLVTYPVATANCVGGICSSNPINLAEDRAHTWEVQAVNFVGTVLSSRRAFSTDFMPTTIVQTAPNEGVTLTTAYPVFVWEDDPDGRIETFTLELFRGTTRVFPATQFNAAVICSGGTCQLNLADYAPAINQNGAYRWRVIGRRSGITNIASSTWRNFTTDVLPAVPQLVAPIAYANVSTLTPTLTWNADARFETFRVLLRSGTRTVADLTNVVAADVCTAGSCSLNLGDYSEQLDQQGVMNWIVYGYTADGLVRNSVAQYFRAVNLLPTALALLTPTNLSVTTNVDPILSWTHDARLDSYSLSLQRPNGTQLFGTPLTVLATSCTTTCEVDLSDHPEALDTIGRYSWLVTGRIDNFLATINSPRWYFTLDNLLPTTIGLVAPAHQTTVRERGPALTWRWDQRVEEYQLTILKTDNTTIHYQTAWLPADGSLCPTTNCVFDLDNGILLASETRHYWYVTGRRSGFDGSANSARWWFGLNYAEPVITQISPAVNHIYNGSSATPTFVWTDDGTYDSFDIVVYNGTRLIHTTPVINANNTTICNAGQCSYDMAANGQIIPEQGAYLYWQVRGTINNYSSPGLSTRRLFQIRNLLPIGAPLAQSPVANTIVYHPTITFQWSHPQFDAYIIAVRVGTNATPIYTQEFQAATNCTTTCSATIAVPFNIPAGAAYWRVQGKMTGMTAQPANASPYVALNLQLLPAYATTNYISPRTTPITRINTPFRWQPDAQNRTDEWIIEVKRGTVPVASVRVPSGSVCGTPVSPTECFYLMDNNLISYDASNVTYYWRVIAVRDFVAATGGTIELQRPGAPVAYGTDLIPDRPILLNPPQGGGSNSSQHFLWEGDIENRASEYKVVLYNADGSFLSTENNIFHAETVNGSTGICNPYQALPGGPITIRCSVPVSAIDTLTQWGSGGTYQWEVRALNSINFNTNGVASLRNTFTMEGSVAGSPALTFNSDGFRVNVRDANESLAIIPLATATLLPTSTPLPSATVDIPTTTPTSTLDVVVTDVVTSTPLTIDNGNTVATDIPTSTPLPTDIPTSTPLPTDIPTSTPVPTDIPTSTPLPTDIPTSTPLPTSTPVPTDIPTDIPTSTPLPTSTPVPTVQVLSLGQAADGTLVQVMFQLCATTCEPVVRVNDTMTGSDVVAIRNDGEYAVYELAAGSYPNLRLFSANYVYDGVNIAP